jgi:8-oxo-dGTP pyrophosphatase MutT (NUDIX family)
MTVVLDDVGERVLLMRRHRFIVDRWVWELPGGYVDDGEDPGAAAAREVEEETGWRPRGIEFVMSCQPVIGNADYPQDLYLAHGAERVREPEIDETAEVQWVPVDETPAMIAKGDILGAITIIGVRHALLRQAAARGQVAGRHAHLGFRDLPAECIAEDYGDQFGDRRAWLFAR